MGNLPSQAEYADKVSEIAQFVDGDAQYTSVSLGHDIFAPTDSSPEEQFVDPGVKVEDLEHLFDTPHRQPASETEPEIDHAANQRIGKELTFSLAGVAHHPRDHNSRIGKDQHPSVVALVELQLAMSRQGAREEVAYKAAEKDSKKPPTVSGIPPTAKAGFQSVAKLLVEFVQNACKNPAMIPRVVDITLEVLQADGLLSLANAQVETSAETTEGFAPFVDFFRSFLSVESKQTSAVQAKVVQVLTMFALARGSLEQLLWLASYVTKLPSKSDFKVSGNSFKALYHHGRFRTNPGTSG